MHFIFKWNAKTKNIGFTNPYLNYNFSPITLLDAEMV